MLFSTGLERKNNTHTHTLFPGHMVAQETICIVVFSCIKSDVLNSSERDAEGAAFPRAEATSPDGTAGAGCGERQEWPPLSSVEIPRVTNSCFYTCLGGGLKTSGTMFTCHMLHVWKSVWNVECFTNKCTSSGQLPVYLRKK